MNFIPGNHNPRKIYKFLSKLEDIYVLEKRVGRDRGTSHAHWKLEIKKVELFLKINI
jgi:hypothetical protein